jgi:hypothetical protein
VKLAYNDSVFIDLMLAMLTSGKLKLTLILFPPSKTRNPSRDLGIEVLQEEKNAVRRNFLA